MEEDMYNTDGKKISPLFTIATHFHAPNGNSKYAQIFNKFILAKILILFY